MDKARFKPAQQKALRGGLMNCKALALFMVPDEDVRTPAGELSLPRLTKSVWMVPANMPVGTLRIFLKQVLPDHQVREMREVRTRWVRIRRSLCDWCGCRATAGERGERGAQLQRGAGSGDGLDGRVGARPLLEALLLGRQHDGRPLRRSCTLRAGVCTDQGGCCRGDVACCVQLGLARHRPAFGLHLHRAGWD